MDFNLVVVAGMVAVRPESIESPQPEAPSAHRLLIAVRSEVGEARVDLIPVFVPKSVHQGRVEAGERIWIAGALQRRFSAASGRSRIEIVAHSVETQEAVG